jgi:stress response protein SCP2
MDDHRLPLTSPVGQVDLIDPTAIFFKTLVHPKHVVDLTLNNKEDDGDGNATKVSWLRNTQPARYHVRLTPFSLIDCFQSVDQLPSNAAVPLAARTDW